MARCQRIEVKGWAGVGVLCSGWPCGLRVGPLTARAPFRSSRSHRPPVPCPWGTHGSEGHFPTTPVATVASGAVLLTDRQTPAEFPRQPQIRHPHTCTVAHPIRTSSRCVAACAKTTSPADSRTGPAEIRRFSASARGAVPREWGGRQRAA